MQCRLRVANELEWLGLRIDPQLNAIDARELSAQGSTVRTFALAVDEELEVALAAASPITGQRQDRIQATKSE